MIFFRNIKYNFFKHFAFLNRISVAACALFIIISCDTTESVEPYQGQVFIKLFGGNGSEEGKDIIALEDGGFVMVGSSTSGSVGGKDVYAVRADSLGNVIWEQRYGNEGDDSGNAVILGSDGSLYVCGETTQNNAVLSQLRDVYVLNLSLDNGSLLQDGIYGDTLRDEYGTGILDIQDRGFLITATGDSSQISSFFMIETDNNLAAIDKRVRYVSGIKGVNNYSTTSFENPELGMNSPVNIYDCFGTVFGDNDTYDFQLFNYTSVSDQLSGIQLYGFDESNDYCTDVYKTTDGGYILGGNSIIGNTSREMTVKIDANNDLIWQKVYTNQYNKNVQAGGIIQTADGGYLISSTIELDDPFNNEISLLKLNFGGDEEWRQTYGSNENDAGAKAVQLANGSYVVVGTMGFDINPNSQSKMCLIKVNPDGDLVPME